MRTTRSAALLLAAVTASALAACTAPAPRPEPAPVAELEPGVYRSVSASSTTDLDFTDPVVPLALTLTKDGNHRLTVDDGCDVKSGPFHLEDGVLTVTTLSATFSTCLPPASDIGVLVDALLAEPVTITVDGADTVWSNSAGEIVFAPAG
ncbi:META domain-containing protein [Rathayibacter oskolensis]|uniref:META domain-containing protein n=1 Tax=Rathayibacter oskolensis TaxID=1891671 RepID=UPI002660297A|nr:META domain-containing protein [Rathayibacter oskolensis]WKK70710.1 META domain-containing protein [Rathayibacter oskolensis]